MDKKTRKDIEQILQNMITTSESLMVYLKKCALDEQSKKICAKSIRQLQKSKEIIPNIKHDDLIAWLYSGFISKNTYLFATFGTIISNQIKKWDTENGYKEFENMVEDVKKEREKQIEERKAVEQARKDGKKVEFVFDPATKKVKPMIIESENKA